MKELLAPANSISKIESAFSYGADAVYLGLSSFSLRKRAAVLSIDDLDKLIKSNKYKDKKIYVVANAVPIKSDLKNVKSFFKSLQKIKIDGVIIQSPYFVKLARKYKLNVIISTQSSLTNSDALNYYYDLGAYRAVLARELNLEEIKNLKTKMELEVFIHGGCCMSYSGRCILSNVLVMRDANRGDCAHSCRWEYNLYNQNNQLIYDKPFSLSSNDLMTIEIFNDLMKVENIKSFKIEGRMKSENYLNTICLTYNYLRNKILKNEPVDFEMLKNELNTTGSRNLSLFNLNDKYNFETQIFNFSKSTPKQNFLGIALKIEGNRVYITQRNKFSLNDKCYFFDENGKSKAFNILNLKDEKNNLIEYANHPEEVVSFDLPFEIKKGALLKKYE